MKKIFISILLSLPVFMVQGQTVFNKIIEDSVKAHIMNSVVALDTGYVYLSGTDNEYFIRCFALTYVNESGEKQWKHIYGDSENQYWEGWSGNFKEHSSIFYLSGPYVNPY